MAGNPINFNDPTGHDADYFCSGNNDRSSRCTGYVQDQATLGSSLGGDSDDTDNDGYPNIPDPDFPPIGPGRHEQSDCVPGNLVECFYSHGVMPGGDHEITLHEFLLLMRAINYDVAQRKATANYDFRAWYDTPFYDLGQLESTLCVQLVGCFARQELNYIAQGASSAAAMEGKTAMTVLVTGWKVDQYKELPSYNTLRAAAIGHDYYVLTHSNNLLVAFTPFRNPVPFIKTVVQYCQNPTSQYC